MPTGKGWRSCEFGIDTRLGSFEGAEVQSLLIERVDVQGMGNDGSGGEGQGWERGNGEGGAVQGCKADMVQVSNVAAEVVRECVGIVGVNGGSGAIGGNVVEGVQRSDGSGEGSECEVRVTIGKGEDGVGFGGGYATVKDRSV